MKQKGFALAAALLMLLLPTGALANSGPVRWEAYAHGELLVVDENSPIEVKHEELLFDLTQGTGDSFAVGGRATATYTMHNPGTKAHQAGMAFPLVAELPRFSPSDVQVRVDGEPVAVNLYIGQAYVTDMQSPDGNALPDYSFATILAALQPDGYTPTLVDPMQTVTLYTFRAARTGAQDVNVTIHFPAAPGVYYLGARDIRGYGQEGDELNLLFSTGAQEAWAEVLVIGDAPAPQITGTLLDDAAQPTGAYTCEVTQETLPLQDYLRAYCTRTAQAQLPAGYASNPQALDSLYALCLRQVDTGLGRAFPFLNDLLEQAFSGSYLLVLQYTADFPANAILEVEVSYPITGEMDRRNTQEPLYRFTYLFSPAQHWAGFGGVAITVKTPEEAPYILDSSLPFTEDAPRAYSAHAATLPEAPLTFTLYRHADLTAVGQAQEFSPRNLGGQLPFLIAGGILVVGLIVSSFIVFRRKGKRDDV